jgi:phosphoenolpyruvate synthase/pyruvate phosphate dikinase
VLPFDRYPARKFAETSPNGCLGTLRVLFAVQQRLKRSTRNFVDFETTAQATFLTSFVPIQRSVQIRQLTKKTDEIFVCFFSAFQPFLV